MKRASAAVPALFFIGILGSACCSTPPPIPDGLRFEHPRTTGRFIIYGDTRASVPFEWVKRETDYSSERGQITVQIVAEKPEFIVHTGDLVGRGSSNTAWAKWDNDMKAVGDSRIVMYAAFGNHEYWYDSGEASTLFALRFPHLQGRHWYGLRYDRVLLVILDSNFDSMKSTDRTAEQNAARQDAWLDRALAEAESDASITTVILCAHHAPYTNSTTHEPDAESQRRFVGRAKKCSKYRAYVAGHVHNYERFVIDGVQYVVAGGGGAPKTAVDVEKPKFKDEFQGPAVRPFQYCVVTVEATRIVFDVIMLKDDGTWYRGDGFVLD